MTREKLQKIYDKEYAQAGDTDEIFMDWAIDYLLALYHRRSK